MEKRRLKKILVLILFSLVLYNPNFIHAQNISKPTNSANIHKSKITIEPTFQEITIAEKDLRKEIFIDLANLTENDLNFKIQMVEVKQIDDQGNIGLNDKPTDITSNNIDYITTINSVKILKNTNEKIKLQVNNSNKLTPGGHYIAVIAKVDVQNSLRENAQIAPALTSFLFIKKTGDEIYQMSLKDKTKLGSVLFKMPTNIDLTYENSGNIHIVPRGVIEIKDIWGRVIKKTIINENSKIIFPSNRRIFNEKFLSISTELPLMFYSLSIKSKIDKQNFNFENTESFIYISPLFVFISIIFITLILYFLKRKNLRVSLISKNEILKND